MFGGVLTACLVWGRLSFGNSISVSFPCISLSAVWMNPQGLGVKRKEEAFVLSLDGNLPF